MLGFLKLCWGPCDGSSSAPPPHPSPCALVLGLSRWFLTSCTLAMSGRECVCGPRCLVVTSRLSSIWHLRSLGVAKGGPGQEPCCVRRNTREARSAWPRALSGATCSQRRRSAVGLCVGAQTRHTPSESLGLVVCVISRLHIWKRYFNFL